jgi:cell division protein FtsL
MAEAYRERSAEQRPDFAPRPKKRRRAGRSPEEWVDWRSVLVFLGLLTLTVLYLLLLTNVRAEVVQLGYELHDLQYKADTLEVEAGNLNRTRQSLRSPQHLTELAADLRLAKPKPAQVVVIHDRPTH